jgi:hypothetical protein
MDIYACLCKGCTVKAYARIDEYFVRPDFDKTDFIYYAKDGCPIDTVVKEMQVGIDRCPQCKKVH